MRAARGLRICLPMDGYSVPLNPPVGHVRWHAHFSSSSQLQQQQQSSTISTLYPQIPMVTVLLPARTRAVIHHVEKPPEILLPLPLMVTSGVPVRGGASSVKICDCGTESESCKWRLSNLMSNLVWTLSSLWWWGNDALASQTRDCNTVSTGNVQKQYAYWWSLSLQSDRFIQKKLSKTYRGGAAGGQGPLKNWRRERRAYFVSAILLRHQKRITIGQNTHPIGRMVMYTNWWTLPEPACFNSIT